MNDYKIGIIGGMGPEATSDFYNKIIKATRARSDQEHFHVVIDSNVKTPDRTKAILGNGESPIKALIETAKNLETLEVDVACIPCMTAHYFIEEVQKEVSYPILNAFEEAQRFIHYKYPGVKKIGILATTGTIKTGLFEKYFTGTEMIYPDNVTQGKKVMEAIYGKEGIKSGVTVGKPVHFLKEAGDELINAGAELIICGCTEIGMILDNNVLQEPKPVVDPMKILANTIVNQSFSHDFVQVKRIN